MLAVKHHLNSRGFTLMELLLVMAIAGILMALTTSNLLRTQNTTTVQTTGEVLISDIKIQQTKAMSGSNNGGYFGVHFDPLQPATYTLFQNTTASYNPSSSSNFPVTAESVTYSATADIIFNPITGEMTPVTLTVAHDGELTTSTIEINKYGVVTQN